MKLNKYVIIVATAMFTLSSSNASYQAAYEDHMQKERGKTNQENQLKAIQDKIESLEKKIGLLEEKIEKNTGVIEKLRKRLIIDRFKKRLPK